MKRIVPAAAVVAMQLVAGPAWSDEIAVTYETFSFEATVVVPQFPCPAGCTSTGELTTTSINLVRGPLDTEANGQTRGLPAVLSFERQERLRPLGRAA